MKATFTRTLAMSIAAASIAAPLPALSQVSAQQPASSQPSTWIDPLTKHRLVRVSPAEGAATLYFHQNSFTPQGDLMAMSMKGGIAVVSLKDWSIRRLVNDPAAILLFTGRKTRSIYFAKLKQPGVLTASTIFAADIDSGAIRKIADVDGWIGSINADETLLLGQKAERYQPLQPTKIATPGTDGRSRRGDEYAANGPDGKPLTFAEAKEVRLNERLEAKVPMEIFTINVSTGERKVVTASTDWLNHIQFSPTDPQQIMYCHEGPWHKVDRIWTIRADGTGKQLVHKRTMNMEIAGHEFFSPDGKTIWYDLQTPRGEVFWVAGYELATGKRRWYNLDRNMWSVHFNQSPDQTRFSGDGGDSEMVAHAPDGKYLYLFKPRDIPDVAGIHAPDAETLITPGTFEAEKLVDMRKHDYRLEPNMIFTPDGKWIVFRANFEGASHVYAVEVAAAQAASGH